MDITFDILIDRSLPPLRMALRDGRLDYDRTSDLGGFAGYLMTLKRGTTGAFGHLVDVNDTTPCDADCFLRKVFGEANVTVVSGHEEIARGYGAKPPRGAVF